MNSNKITSNQFATGEAPLQAYHKITGRTTLQAYRETREAYIVIIYIRVYVQVTEVRRLWDHVYQDCKTPTLVSQLLSFKSLLKTQAFILAHRSLTLIDYYLVAKNLQIRRPSRKTFHRSDSGQL